jgi:haloalkane dehalogenase
MLQSPPWLDTAAWPFPGQLLPLRDGRLHYIDEGGGPTWLFVHGTPTWSFEWRHIIKGLPQARRIAFDHLGFGLSDRPAGADYSPAAHARRFAEAMELLPLPKQITLVVHDFGGPIALDWALQNPQRIGRLVVLNSFMWSFADDPQMWQRAQLVSGKLGRFLYRYANASLRLIMPSAYGDRRRLTPAIHRQYLAPFADGAARVQVLWPLAHGLSAASPYFQSLWDRRSALAKTPVDIVWGLRDSAFQPTQLAKWQLGLPHARVSRIENAGHWPHEESPAAVLAALAT